MEILKIFRCVNIYCDNSEIRLFSYLYDRENKLCLSENRRILSSSTVQIPGGGVLPYKGLMGTCGQPGYVLGDFCLKQGIKFIIFCLNQGIDLSIFVLINKISLLGR